jgi:MSHA biogenesis protein MshP
MMRKKQQGLSLVLAIFVLVVLSLLAGALFNIMSVGTDSVAREVLSARALMAANSGAEINLNELFPPGSATAASNCLGTASAPRTVSINGLLGCADTELVCTATVVDGVNYFTISSTGYCGPASEPAVRTVQVQARDF